MQVVKDRGKAALPLPELKHGGQVTPFAVEWNVVGIRVPVAICKRDDFEPVERLGEIVRAGESRPLGMEKVEVRFRAERLVHYRRDHRRRPHLDILVRLVKQGTRFSQAICRRQPEEMADELPDCLFGVIACWQHDNQ